MSVLNIVFLKDMYMMKVILTKVDWDQTRRIHRLIRVCTICKKGSFHIDNMGYLPLIQEGQLSVTGERMCTILVNRLED